MRSTVSQFASPMVETAQFSIACRYPALRAIGREASHEVLRQLELQTHVVGLVRPREDASTLVTQRERIAVAVRNAERDGLADRQRRLDGGEESGEPLAG